MPSIRQMLPFSAALLFTLATALIALLARPTLGNAAPLTIFLLPILLTGYFGNVPAALVAVVLATLAGSYVCFDPVGSFRVDAVTEQARLAGFLIVAAGIAFFAARLARAHHQVVASELRLRQSVYELHRLRDHQQLLLRELKHRIRNMLATIDGIALQTAQFSRSLPEFQAAFSERVRALAKVNDVLTSANWAEVSIRDLIQSEFSARTLSNLQVELRGPTILVKSGPALALHMVIHELCTNSAKYGSLSVPHGRVSVSWSIGARDGESRFTLLWTESEGPPVEPPRRRGFGSELFRRTIEYELSGEANLEFQRSGLVCSLSFPWTEQLGPSCRGDQQQAAGGNDVANIAAGLHRATEPGPQATRTSNATAGEGVRFSHEATLAR